MIENNFLAYEIALVGFTYKYKFALFEIIEFNFLNPFSLFSVLLRLYESIIFLRLSFDSLNIKKLSIIVKYLFLLLNKSPNKLYVKFESIISLIVRLL